MQSDYIHILREERKRLLDALRATQFSKLNEHISHAQCIPYASYSPWLDDQIFMDTYKKISDNTLVDIYRCYELWSLAKQLEEQDGDMIEIGVWRGGSGAVIGKAAINSKGTLYLADTFTGVVKAGKDDTLYKGGEHNDTEEETVVSLLTGIGISNYRILKGIFPDDFPLFETKGIKLCHIDVDTFLSAADIMDFVWPKMLVGGIVVFDDYGFFGCEGITQYVNQLNLIDARLIYNINGHGILIKYR